MTQKASFDKVSSQWENTDKQEFGRKNAMAYSKQIDHLIENKKVDVLDFGCGTLYSSLPLIQSNNKINKLDGIDLSEEMLKIAQKKIEALEDEDLKKRIKVQKVSVKRPQDLTEKYDVIITSMTLHHIFNTKEIVGILKTALKDGGHFMWIDYQKTESSYYFHPEDFREEVIPGFTKEEMIQILEINGFKNITVSVVQHVSKVQRVNNEDVQVELDIFLVCGRLN